MSVNVFQMSRNYQVLGDHLVGTDVLDLFLLPSWPVVEQQDDGFCNYNINTHRIHVWYIYLHLVDFYGRYMHPMG